jgi:hypothetical protein
LGEGWQVLDAVNPTMVQGATLADFTPLSGFSVTVSGCAGH